MVLSVPCMLSETSEMESKRRATDAVLMYGKQPEDPCCASVNNHTHETHYRIGRVRFLWQPFIVGRHLSVVLCCGVMHCRCVIGDVLWVMYCVVNVLKVWCLFCMCCCFVNVLWVCCRCSTTLLWVLCCATRIFVSVINSRVVQTILQYIVVHRTTVIKYVINTQFCQYVFRFQINNFWFLFFCVVIIEIWILLNWLIKKIISLFKIIVSCFNCY